MTTSDLEIYTLDEAAEKLHVTPTWYMRQLRERKLPGRKFGRKWMLTRADLEAALEQMAVPAIVPTPDPHGLSPVSRRRLKRRGGAA